MTRLILAILIAIMAGAGTYAALDLEHRYMLEDRV